MNCPRCKNSTELQKRQVGLDDYHEPVYNEFAICKPCKKQWNLDKIRAKKAEALERKKAAGAVADLRPIGYNDSKNKRKPAKPGVKTLEKPPNKARHRSSSDTSRESTRKASGSSRSHQKRGASVKRTEKPALFPVRIIFCVVSLIGFGYWIAQGFRAGLDSIEGIPSEYSSIYIILAICFFVAAVFWWLLRRKNAFYVYFLPMISYIVGFYITFSHRAEASHLLIAAIAGAIFGILCILVAALAKTSQNLG